MRGKPVGVVALINRVSEPNYLRRRMGLYAKDRSAAGIIGVLHVYKVDVVVVRNIDAPL